MTPFKFSTLALLIHQVGLALASAAFSITSFEHLSDGQVRLNFTADTSAYYILYRGPDLLQITQAIALVQPQAADAGLTDPSPGAGPRFYRIGALPQKQPGDTDGDGINDLFEARFAPCLDPFNPADASLDCNGDGRSNLQEYQAGTDPGLINTQGGVHLVINEIDYDQTGTDNAEFVEIFNPSSTPVDLAHLALILIDGNRKTEYARVLLEGTLDPGGYLVIGSSNVNVSPPARLIRFAGASNQLQNGAPDGLALVNLATQQLIDGISYEGSISAAVISGFPGTYNLVEGNPLPAAVADSNSAAGSLIRFPNGKDTNDGAADWKFTSLPTPGGPNQVPPP